MAVYLVGAGPGDPELLTLKAARLLECADAVVYDRLVSAGVLALVSPAAERYFVGKEQGLHHVGQDAINRLLVHLGRLGGVVVRLKGGDPYVLGRGGEEAVHLARHGVAVEVVPGVTAAGTTAYAGFPLTHRGLASGVAFVAGHCQAAAARDWSAYAAADLTLVVYMGLGQAGAIAAGLMAAGRDPETPAALIENGSTPAQRTRVTTLAGLGEAARAGRFRSPTLIVIGAVVALAEVLAPPAGATRAPAGQPAAEAARA